MTAKSQGKLVIIEDDEAFANVLARRLSSKGFEAYHAVNANDALMLCRTHMPSFVLVDMKLADDNGLELLKPLRALLPQARIILLTGFASIATAVDAIKLGADDYLPKPVDTQTLLNTLLVKSEGVESEIDDIEETVMSPQRLEWEHIQQVLKANDGNISATARQLQMHRRTLQRKLQKKPKIGL